jgi:hypothetical protein
MTIPPSAATGEYRLNRIDARAEDGSAMYNETDYHVASIEIENPKTFTPPAIAVKPLP